MYACMYVYMGCIYMHTYTCMYTFESVFRTGMYINAGMYI